MIPLLMSTVLMAHSPGANLPDGTILYLTNSSKAVHLVTDSNISHVALLLSDSKKRRWVYEATPARVRRVALSEYHHELSDLNKGRDRPMQLFALAPTKAYSSSQVKRMLSYVSAQLGRRYSVKGYVRKKQAKGIHCAELVSRAVERTGRAQFKQNYAMSPDEVVAKVASLYNDPNRLRIETRQQVETRTWCERSWAYWSGWGNLCGWSLQESWSWCW
jgi:hypothetical protein